MTVVEAGVVVVVVALGSRVVVELHGATVVLEVVQPVATKAIATAAMDLMIIGLELYMVNDVLWSGVRVLWICKRARSG